MDAQLGRNDDRAESSRNEVPGDDCNNKHRFFQVTVGQMLMLIAVIGALFGVLMPDIHQTLLRRQRVKDAERLQAALAALTYAVRNNDLALTRRALEAGANPNLPSRNEISVLYDSIVNGRLDILELLLESGADAEQANEAPANLPGQVFGGGLPLFAAVGCKQPFDIRSKMIRLLVAHGADPHRQLYNRNAMDMTFDRPDPQMCDLLREYRLPYGPREMAAFNRLDELKRFVKESPEIVSQRFPHSNYAGQSPTLLAIALRRRYREMAQFLIESGAPLDMLVYEGSTHLHQAARGGDPELVRLLVSRGMDVNATDNYSDTPLTDSAWGGNPQVIAALIEAGADVNHQGVNRRTALHGAAGNDQVETVRLLLAAGGDPTLRDHKGETPVDLARAKNSQIAEILSQAIAAKAVSDRN